MFFEKFKISLLLFLACLNFKLTAQVKYVTDSSYVKLLSHNQKNNLGGFLYHKIDSTINHFQNYFTRNSNGNYGLANRNLELSETINPIGFNLYQLPYQNDLFTQKSINYYQTKGPFASLTGIAGSKQEQQFKLLFTNTFKNKLNLTLAFNRYSGLGFYNRQQSFVNNFYVSSNYTTKNNRFGYYANFCFNKLKHSENGGVKNDSLILNNTSINKLLIGVNFKNAKRELRTTSFEINPWFKLNKTDSVNTSHFINYQLNYSGNFTKYTDPNSYTEKNYNVFYIDSATTKDSVHWRSIANALNYKIKIAQFNTSFQVGLATQYNQVHQNFDSAFISNSVNAVINYNKKNLTSLLKTNYIISGANKTDYLIELNNQYNQSIFKSDLQFKLNLSLQNTHPDFIYNTWNTNHYSWNNTFKPLQKIQALFSFNTSNNKLSIGTLMQNTTNYLYFDEQAQAQQTSISIQTIKTFIKKDFLFIKHLGLNLGYIYQTSSYNAIIALPNHVLNSAMFYQGNLFKNALQLQVGFNVQYYSSFYGNEYNQATNQFNIQTTNKTGNYPFVDFFITARIKPVRFFIKIDHINQSLTGNNYQLVPNYYQNDRALKFGLNWLFFD